MPYTATYDYVYYLKDLQGDGYTEFYRISDIRGVMSTTVTAEIRTFDEADFEYATPTFIDQSTGMEVPAYYTRKQFTLSFESLGGSFIAPLTALYGESLSVAGLVPTRTGYNFLGWYDAVDEDGHAAGNPVTGDVELSGDQTLYAKWEGQQVGYTILYMREQYSAAGNTYVFDRSGTGTARWGRRSSPPMRPALPTTSTGMSLTMTATRPPAWSSPPTAARC